MAELSWLFKKSDIHTTGSNTAGLTYNITHKSTIHDAYKYIRKKGDV